CALPILTLAAACAEGLACRLVIEERVPGSYDEGATGNNMLFRLLGAERITAVPAGTDLATALQAEAEDVATAGRVPYVIPGGGSNPLGALGYVAAAEELMGQAADRQLAFQALVVASGSG